MIGNVFLTEIALVVGQYLQACLSPLHGMFPCLGLSFPPPNPFRMAALLMRGMFGGLFWGGCSFDPILF